jgi:hypothetical protein
VRGYPAHGLTTSRKPPRRTPAGVKNNENRVFRHKTAMAAGYNRL